MSKVVHITKEQADELRGKMFAPDSFFNPIEDKEGNWFISVEEVAQLRPEKVEFEFIKTAREIDHKPQDSDKLIEDEPVK